MSGSTKIYLPLHVRSRHILVALAKISGTAFEQIPFKGGTGLVDTSCPAGVKNPWKAVPEDSEKEPRVSLSHALEHGYLNFYDAAGQNHEWIFHQEISEEEAKLLSPGSHGFAVAVGRRLVRFFGGELVYNDEHNDRDDCDESVSPHSARFPPREKNQNNDERLYQFQNTLFAEPMLSARELKVCLEQFDGNSTHRKLLDYLTIIQNKKSLEGIANSRLHAKTPSHKAPKI